MMQLERHKRKRDRKTIAACRKPYCERCRRAANIEPHHMFSVGSGGCDIKENLIQLCTQCHIDTHAGNIEREELLAIVAKREGVTADELYRANRRAMGWDV